MFDFILKVFYTVALRMSFTRAAAELYISQPAVTRHIRKLEEQFRQKLFERRGNKIALTSGGEVLLEHVQQLFALHRQMYFDMNSLINLHQGDLRLGASTTITQYVIPALLARFHEDFPDIRVQFLNGNT